jgi:HK97 family phage major capsid protein
MNIKSLFFAAFASNPAKVVHHGIRRGKKEGLAPELIKHLSEQLDGRDKHLMGLLEKANNEAKTAGEVSKGLKDEIEKHVKGSNEMLQRLNDLEVELAGLKSKGLPTPEGSKSAGEQMTDSEDFKALQQKGRGTAVFRLKAINTINSGPASSTGGAGAAIAPDRLPGILMPALRRLTIRDLLLPGRTSSNLIQYVKETGYQNMAAAIAEGALKPQSDLTFDLAEVSVKTIAHWVRATVQILADVPALQSYIDQRLTYGLKYVEETELLSGDGTGNHLLGLIAQATAFDTTKTKVGDTKIDTIRRAILQVRIALYSASGIVLNPVDWADIEMAKDNQGRYIWVNVTTGGVPQLWRLPVIDSDAIPAGHFMVGAFNIAAQIFDREDANVQVSTEDQDNFVKNLVTIRAEERLALVVYRPEAIVYGTFPESGSGPTT